VNYYLNQARSTVTQELIGWVTLGPDWTGLSFPGPGSPEYVAATELVGKSVYVGVTFERDFADEVGLEDQGSAGNQVEGEGSDFTLVLTDDLAWLKDLGTAASASIAVSDLLKRTVSKLRRPTDSINIVDLLTYVRDSSNTHVFNRFIADSIAVGDQVGHDLQGRDFQDLIIVGDDTHRQLYESDGTISLGHDDTIAITDSTSSELL
jgi:hypothetical protein